MTEDMKKLDREIKRAISFFITVFIVGTALHLYLFLTL